MQLSCFHLLPHLPILDPALRMFCAMPHKKRDQELAQELAPLLPTRVSTTTLGRPHQKLGAGFPVHTPRFNA